MAQTIYYFDGSSGCDRCIAASGYSLDEPERPHADCDCPIIEYEASELDFCERKLRNLWITDCEDSVQASESYEYCDRMGEGIILEVGEDKVENFDEGVRELAEEGGWAPPEINLEFPFGAAHNAVTRLDYTILRYLSFFEAEVYYTCTFPDGTTTEVASGETATGEYDTNYRAYYNSSHVEPCRRDHQDPEDVDPEDYDLDDEDPSSA